MVTATIPMKISTSTFVGAASAILFVDRKHVNVEPGNREPKSTQPLSAYLHIPFCEKKCIYCDFYSIENVSLRGEFVELLLQEIALKLAASPSLSGRTLETIFFGGGTPSLLTPEELARIITALKSHFTISENVEFTLECNPGTVTLAKLSGYRALGVNRLSFGVQSFDQAELDFLGRIHNAAEAREAVRLARAAGFENVSIDLIFALPGQNEATLANTLREAIALGTDHISAYNLIVEPGTPLFRLVQMNKIIELDPDRAAQLFDLTQRTLEEAGFEQYEISNYARSTAKRAKHNLVYWDGAKEYISFGPSAHEFLEGRRDWNVSSLEQYKHMIASGSLPILQSETLTTEERRTEVAYLQLRSTGIDLVQFEQAFGEALMDYDEVHALIGDEMLVWNDGKLCLTQKGYRFCDGIVTRLLRQAELVG
jgi:oxygen-independent coproporphyrinogen-3 oxidase